MPQLPVVNVGVIGLGTDWQSRYLPALLKMQQRIRVVSVHDDVATRAEVTADQLQSSFASGVRDLLNQTDVRGWLYLGTHWRTDWLIEQFASRGVAVFVGRDVRTDVDQLRRWHQRADDAGVTVLPELPLRFTPAILRLRELMATDLGPVTSMKVEAASNGKCAAETSAMIQVVDCCCALLRRHLVEVEYASDRNGDIRSVRLAYRSFRQSEPADEPVAVEVTLNGSGNVVPTAIPSLTIELRCRRGVALLCGEQNLRWEAEGHTSVEKLNADRSSAEVMLDLFARRVVGGLVPVPDLADQIQAIEDANRVMQVFRQCSAADGPQ
ncbi:MAG: Gfo/Idh/MocA family oxidoreductase [Planctomycetaceae bacterium]|nr:Gfo/Idh/MocA family oxidoreductase [Planctomycetaceae bacterium]